MKYFSIKFGLEIKQYLLAPVIAEDKTWKPHRIDLEIVPTK